MKHNALKYSSINSTLAQGFLFEGHTLKNILNDTFYRAKGTV